MRNVVGQAVYGFSCVVNYDARITSEETKGTGERKENWHYEPDVLGKRNNSPKAMFTMTTRYLTLARVLEYHRCRGPV